MNKLQTYRLGKTIFPFYAFFVMFAMTFASCRNNLTTAESIEPNEATTPSFRETAKQWFESNKAMLSTTKYAKIEPRWNRIRDLGNRVELPYYIDSNVHLMTTRENAKPNQIGRSYMMLLKTKESYKIHFIDFIPADDFLGDLRTINSANFKSEKFTGYVIFRDEKGAVLTCYSYKDGKNRGKGTIITSDKNSFRATAGCKTGECMYEVIGHYRNGELTRISQNLLYCYCIENTDDSGGNGGNDGDTDGGTGDDCTWCGENNDCTTEECRCTENPNLPECPCKCNNRSEKKNADHVEFNFVNVTRLNVNIEVGLTGKDCTNGTATCSNSFYIFNPTIAEISLPKDNVEAWEKVPFSGKTNCGFNVTYWSRGLITVTPKYLAAGEVGDTKDFEGWPNFNID